MKLYIGNKNYSSWSMRPWVALRMAGIDFEEVLVPFDFGPGSRFGDIVGALSPARRVPILVDDDGLVVWDSLAIIEYAAERFPDRQVWPTDRAARARARSLCAEMHGGFAGIRSLCPMNIELDARHLGPDLLARHPKLATDLARLDAMWSEARSASGGPGLFGPWGGVDAYYAPVVMRVRSYGLPLSSSAQEWANALAAHPATQAWMAAALTEHTYVVEDEPYRPDRTTRAALPLP